MLSGLFAVNEASPSPEPQAWSSAIGHASTGKSGRVIERLQGDIDRLHREKQLLKVRYEESEKNNEALQTRCQYLQDRNSNYEQSHEANLRQLARRERQLEELREDLKKGQHRTAAAEKAAQSAAVNEEQWRQQASQAKSIATQKETEYDVIVSCRKLDNDRHQTGLDKVKENIDRLLDGRQADLENYRKLEIVAEQQQQTINQLEELTRKLSANFKAYKNEIDKAIAGMREHVNSNDSAIAARLDEMTRVTGEMRWVMNVEENINHRGPQTGVR